MKITNDMIWKEVIKSREQGELTDELAILAIEIAKILYASEKYRKCSWTLKEEFISQFTLSLTRGWKNINPYQNPKAYLQILANWSALEVLRNEKKINDRKKFLKNTAKLYKPTVLSVERN